MYFSTCVYYFYNFERIKSCSFSMQTSSWSFPPKLGIDKQPIKMFVKKRIVISTRFPGMK